MSTGWSSHNEWGVWRCLVSTTISSGESPFTLALINCERESGQTEREGERETGSQRIKTDDHAGSRARTKPL